MADWTADFVDFPEGRGADVGFEAGVYVKAGASEVEPERVIEEDGTVRLNVDKGNQKNSGENAVLLGDIRNGRPGCGEDVPFAGETVRYAARITVTADEEGGLWLLLGSESAFETPKELHFTAMRVSLERVSG